MTDQNLELIDPRLVEIVADYASHPDDLAALFYLGAHAAILSRGEVTPRTAVDLAVVTLRAHVDLEPDADAALSRLIAALWPEPADAT